MKNFLKIENLSIELKTFTLKNVSFSLEKGDYLTIIGPTGAGKTILLETIIGFYKPQKGKIIIQEKDITNVAPESRNIGIIYQDYLLFPHLTVKKNIEYGITNKDYNTNKEIIEICNILKIDNLLDRFPGTLSGGEKQRVALARALVVKPKLLLMDEPFSALDIHTKIKIRQLVREVVAKFNITVIHITHDFDDVWALSNKIAIIRDGELIQFGLTEQIMFKPKNKFIAEFTDTNIVEGKVEKIKNNLSFISIGSNVIKSIDIAKVGEKVKVAIRPESIILFKEKPENLSARNVLNVKFVDYFIENRVYHIILSADGIKLKAILTSSAFEDLELKKGDNVKAIIKATNVRIV